VIDVSLAIGLPVGGGSSASRGAADVGFG